MSMRMYLLYVGPLLAQFFRGLSHLFPSVGSPFPQRLNCICHFGRLKHMLRKRGSEMRAAGTLVVRHR